MFWMMNGRNRRGMGGGLFLLPGLLFGGLFGIYAVLAVLNVAGIVIGAVVSGLAAAFSGLLSAAGAVFSGIGEDIGSIGSVVIGIAIGLWLVNMIRNRRKGARDVEEE